MSILKKLGIALLVILLLAVAAGYFLTRGDTADVAFDETVGTDPTLDEPEEESIPTVAIAEPVGWADGELPLAAEGLVVNRFADGLDHPRTLQALPNGDILVTLTRAPKLDTGEGGNWLRDLASSSAKPVRAAKARMNSCCCAMQMAMASPRDVLPYVMISIRLRASHGATIRFTSPTTMKCLHSIMRSAVPN